MLHYAYSVPGAVGCTMSSAWQAMRERASHWSTDNLGDGVCNGNAVRLPSGLERDALRQSFKTSSLPRGTPTENLHAAAAVNRSNVDRAINELCSELHVTVHSVSMSKRDERLGMLGSRRYYHVKDLLFPPRNSEGGDVCKMIDVDFFVEPSEFWDHMDGCSKPLFMYTWSPGGPVGSDGELSFSFKGSGEGKDEWEFHMPAATNSRYCHPLWNWNTDVLVFNNAHKCGFGTKTVCGALLGAVVGVSAIVAGCNDPFGRRSGPQRVKNYDALSVAAMASLGAVSGFFTALSKFRNVVCSVEQRNCSPNRQMVAVIPSRSYGWLASILHVNGKDVRPLERYKPLTDGTMAVMPLVTEDGVSASIGRLGCPMDPLVVDMGQVAGLLALHELATAANKRTVATGTVGQLLKKGRVTGKVGGGTSDANADGALVLRSIELLTKLATEYGRPCIMVGGGCDKRITYTVGTVVETTTLKPSMRMFMPPMVSMPALNRLITKEDVSVTITDRIERAKQLGSPVAPNRETQALIDEFVSYIASVVGNNLVPLTDMEMRDRCDTLTKRHVTEAGLEIYAELDPCIDECTFAFIKREAVNNGKSSRIISPLPEAPRVASALFMIPMGQAMKAFPWYSFRYAPEGLGEALVDACAAPLNEVGADGFTRLAATDFKRLDGTVKQHMRDFELAVWLQCFGEDYADEVRAMHEHTHNRDVILQGQHYKQGPARGSGEPGTSPANTLINALVAYVYHRKRGLSQADAAASLVAHAGDDGLIAGVDSLESKTMLEDVAFSMGLFLEVDRLERGEPVPYLGRLYGELDVCRPNSCSDVDRRCKKMHLTVLEKHLYPDTMVAVLKAMSLILTDPNTPILGSWARAVCYQAGLLPAECLDISVDITEIQTSVVVDYAKDIVARGEARGKLGIMDYWALKCLGSGDRFVNENADWMYDTLPYSPEQVTRYERQYVDQQFVNGIPVFERLDNEAEWKHTEDIIVDDDLVESPSTVRFCTVCRLDKPEGCFTPREWIKGPGFGRDGRVCIDCQTAAPPAFDGGAGPAGPPPPPGGGAPDRDVTEDPDVDGPAVPVCRTESCTKPAYTVEGAAFVVKKGHTLPVRCKSCRDERNKRRKTKCAVPNCASPHICLETGGLYCKDCRQGRAPAVTNTSIRTDKPDSKGKSESAANAKTRANLARKNAKSDQSQKNDPGKAKVKAKPGLGQGVPVKQQKANVKAAATTQPTRNGAGKASDTDVQRQADKAAGTSGKAKGKTKAKPRPKKGGKKPNRPGNGKEPAVEKGSTVVVQAGPTITPGRENMHTDANQAVEGQEPSTASGVQRELTRAEQRRADRCGDGKMGEGLRQGNILGGVVENMVAGITGLVPIIPTIAGVFVEEAVKVHTGCVQFATMELGARVLTAGVRGYLGNLQNINALVGEGDLNAANPVPNRQMAAIVSVALEFGRSVPAFVMHLTTALLPAGPYRVALHGAFNLTVGRVRQNFVVGPPAQAEEPA